jgi:peptide/nickel transport system ATP-binding protein
MPLLEVSDLRTSFFLRSGELKVLDGVDLEIEEGEVLGLVGETGSGKSVTAYSIIRLLKQPGRIVGGEVRYRGRDLVSLWESELEQEIRGKEISMIFQNPREALNPVITVGRQLTQVLRIRRGMSKREARQEAINIVKSLYISDPVSRLSSYPHQLSGGMAQRIMISLALSCEPRLLIADEPTTGLDVTTQYQIVQLLRELRQRTGMAILIITHDLALAAQICDRVAVLYAGRIAEVGRTEYLFRSPRHPYTKALLASRPRLGLKGDIATIPGNVANLMQPPGGCRFHPRCPNAISVCSEFQPPLEQMEPGQLVACHNPVMLHQEVAASG